MTFFLIALYIAIGIYAGVRFARYEVRITRKPLDNDDYVTAGIIFAVAVALWPMGLLLLLFWGIGRLVGKGA